MTNKICISGYYGFDNFGDETILDILVNNLKRFKNPPEITVFSSNPKKTEKLYNIKSVYSFDIFHIIKELFLCNTLISGGGSLLQDATSKKSLIYYLSVLSIAKLFGKNIIIFAQGIGPINNIILKKLTAYLLRHAKYVCVRDLTSLKLLTNWKVKAEICSDPVWNIETNINTIKTNKIGIQLRNYHTVNDFILEELAICINKYYKDKEIYIFSLQNKIDLEICERLKTLLLNTNSDLKIKVIENTSNRKVIEDISSVDELIAMRYHACLIGLKSNVKLLPVSYDIKVKELAGEFNLNYIDMEHPEKIKESFEKFINSDIKYDKEKLDNLRFDFKKIENVI